MSYWDSSALVKLSVMEADSADFESITSPNEQITASAIARLEVRAALHRCEAEGAIPPGEAKVLASDFDRDAANGRVLLQSISDEVEREFESVLETCYSQTPPLRIRTNDAIHLATAIVGGELTFVSADARRRTAAALLGLTVRP